MRSPDKIALVIIFVVLTVSHSTVAALVWFHVQANAGRLIGRLNDKPCVLPDGRIYLREVEKVRLGRRGG